MRAKSYLFVALLCASVVPASGLSPQLPPPPPPPSALPAPPPPPLPGTVDVETHHHVRATHPRHHRRIHHRKHHRRHHRRHHRHHLHHNTNRPR